MKKISFVLLVVCLCLSAVSCEKLFRPKTVYMHYEFMADEESFSGDIENDWYSGDPYEYDLPFFRNIDGSLNTSDFFIHIISYVDPSFDIYIGVKNRESDFFIDGKNYSYSRFADDCFGRITAYFYSQSIQFHNVEQAEVQFDLVERDGVSYSFSFDITFRNTMPVYDVPHTVKGRIDVHNTLHGKKIYDTYIKRSE